MPIHRHYIPVEYTIDRVLKAILTNTKIKVAYLCNTRKLIGYEVKFALVKLTLSLLTKLLLTFLEYKPQVVV